MVTTTQNGEQVSVFINGLESTSAADSEATQYDGIGYRAINLNPPPEPKHRDVFLLAGQSNCDGRGLASQLSGSLSDYAGPQPEILIHYTNPSYGNSNRTLYQNWVTLRPGFSRPPGYGGSLPSPTFGTEIGAGKVLSQFYDNPAFIKVAEGGTALGVPGQDWYVAPLDSPNVGPLYEALIDSTRAALDALEARGDTYTVHGLFWHQGESDGGRTAQYDDLLAGLIAGVRDELDLPNLRFLVGELAATKAQSFRNVQWQVARDSHNVGFIASTALTTSDSTHFDAPSMITFGQRVGFAFRPDRTVFDFEAPVVAAGPLDRQDEWAADAGITVVNTSSLGEYSGGQAVGPGASTGLSSFNRRHALPLASANSMQCEVYADAANATLLLAGWADDTNTNGRFSANEAAVGLGLDSSGAFQIRIGDQTYLSSGFSYQVGHWYRLSLTWSDPDPSGDRTVQLFARDLSSGLDLNGGNAILSVTASSAEFAAQPMSWSGIGALAADAWIDNVQTVLPGFGAWQSVLYPTLAGGPLGDDDGDSIANAVEFAFGLNPLVANPSRDLPQPVFSGAEATVSFEPPPAQPGTIYGVEWSEDLEHWNLAEGVRSGPSLIFTIPTPNDRMFLRHRIDVAE
jgi:hypothetical protein